MAKHPKGVKVFGFAGRPASKAPAKKAAKCTNCKNKRRTRR